jgi:hypothetical protein
MQQRIFLGLVLALSLSAAQAQQIHQKMEQRFIYNNKTGDSTQLHLKNFEYDSLGRLMSREEFYYDPQEKGILQKEETAQYEFGANLLQEKTRQYPRGQEPKTEKRISYFLEYTAKAEDQKPKLVQLLDNFNEPVREDTFTYDAKNRLIKQCTYDYRGSTSLFCDQYEYNRQGLRKKWTTYAKWTTVKRGGKAVYEQAKRREYRFWYNKKGQLTKAKGYYYKSKLKQRVQYDKAGKILLDETVVERKLRNSKEQKAKTGQKFKREKETKRLEYQDGRLLKESLTSLEGEQRRVQHQYQDTLLQQIEFFQKDKLVERQSFEYHSNGKLKQRKVDKFSELGSYQYSIISNGDEKGNIIEEIQQNEQRIISRASLRYNEDNLLVEKTLFLASGLKFEKIAYFYKYY